MSLTDFIVPVSSQTDGADEYDHAIVLVDATKPAKPNSGPSNDDGTTSLSREGTGTQLGKRWTKGTLREELVRRKYAKWQEDKTEDTDESLETSASDQTPTAEGANSDQTGAPRKGPVRTGRLRNKNPFKKARGNARRTEESETAIDILYENQRGWFFCGIPLYSGRSLLPIDPSAWQTATFHYSPVNITNAQLPDPSWVWAWKTWYVDMSYDVDEEGWQYSFNFGQWAWHGTHPWFHSFVRRRRWLRKRVKSYYSKAFGDTGNLKQAHMLNEDYFTIHASRDRSRDSSADRTVNHHSSFLSGARSESDSEQDTGDVSDILKLMAAVKRARVDREKLWAVKSFVGQGGDELFYLADSIDDIMEKLIYRTSRRQLQSLLLQEQTTGEEQKQKDDEDQKDEDEALVKKINGLSKAVVAAEAYIENDSRIDPNGNQARCDTQDTDSGGNSATEEGANSSNAIRKEPERGQDDENFNREEDGTTNTDTDEDEVEGIPASEEASLTLSSTEAQIQEQKRNSGPSNLAKGKEKA